MPTEAVPAYHKDLSGLPPTFIGVRSIDLFVAEDKTYAKRLIEAGVSTQLEVVLATFHGFDRIGANTKVVQNFAVARLNAIRQAFA